MRKLLFLLILLPSLSWGACGGSSPTWTAASASYADVNDCVTAASSGDTINVPSGTETWNTQLTITKTLTIQGAGVGNTNITSNVGSSNWLIYYYPIASADLTAGTPIIISGFTFDFNNNSKGVFIAHASPTLALQELQLYLGHLKKL